MQCFLFIKKKNKEEEERERNKDKIAKSYDMTGDSSYFLLLFKRLFNIRLSFSSRRKRDALLFLFFFFPFFIMQFFSLSFFRFYFF